MFTGKKILFMGAGNLCEAIIKGLISKGGILPGNVWVANKKNQDRLQYLRHHYGIEPVTDKKKAASKADVVFLVVKPQSVYESLEEIKAAISKKQLIITVLAGVPTTLIEDYLGGTPAVVRAMPNTSCAVLQSATGLSAGRYTTPDQLAFAERIFNIIGEAVVLPEESLDAVTGLSGSGPAYIYYLAEALEKAGEEAGLSKEAAGKLVLKTLFGAATMLQQTGESPEALRQKVTSPNGTTMAGLDALKQGNFSTVIKNAVFNATQRSKELGAAFNSSK